MTTVRLGCYLCVISSALFSQTAMPVRAQDSSLSPDERERMFAQGKELFNRTMELTGKGAYREALAASQEMLQIERRLFGEEHVNMAVAYSNVSAVQGFLGDFDQARKLNQQALALIRKTLGENNAMTAASYNNLGNLELQLGNYPAARTCIEQALKIRVALLGENHEQTSASYNSLGVLNQNLGEYAEARRCLERALDINRKLFGDDTAGVAGNYGNLAILYADLDDFPKARDYYERVLRICRASLGEEDLTTAATYDNLGGVMARMGDYATALKYHERALSIERKIFGENSFGAASTYNNLGLVLEALGDYSRARQNYESGLDLKLKFLGSDHPFTASSYANFMMLEAKLGDWPAAAKWIDRQRRCIRRHVARVLPSLSEMEQRQFLEETDKAFFDQALSLGYLRRTERQICDQSAAWLLNGKGVGQQALAERTLLARETPDLSLAPLVEQLTDVRRQLAQSSLAAPKVSEIENHHRQLAELATKEADLTRRLVQAGGAAQEDRDPWIEVDTVRKALPPGSVLIDIGRFQIASLGEKKAKPTWGPARYVAWIIRPIGNDPSAAESDVQIVDLGEADPIDAQIKNLRQALQGVQGKRSTLTREGEPKAEADVRIIFQQLADRIWGPLAMHVGPAKELFLSPDGPLWLVPWGAIPEANGKFLIERLSITYLVCGRDIARSTRAPTANVRKPVIFADPNFDLSPDQVTTAVKAVLRTTFQGSEHGRRTNDKSLLPRVERLPGTAAEADAIKPNVEKMTGQTPILYRDVYALESVAKALNRPKVAIFSTHGFFLPDQEGKQDKKNSQLTLAGNDNRAVPLTIEGKPFENPLLRCGLLFAGCNARNEGQPGSGDDGVLTAMEIVGIDFRGTELVVLSACETGVGTVNNGEGVAGLRQAFQLAGAEAVVATLWQIPDADSARLMNDFFANLAAGQSKGDALRNAQLKRIETRRERYGAAHPFFWAAYTLTGR